MGSEEHHAGSMITVTRVLEPCEIAPHTSTCLLSSTGVSLNYQPYVLVFPTYIIIIHEDCISGVSLQSNCKDAVQKYSETVIAQLLKVSQWVDNRSTYGRRAFSVAGPMTWNSLTDSLRDPSLSIDSFRCQLKTFLFDNIRPCVFSALEIFSLMRYINRRFTNLLT